MMRKRIENADLAAGPRKERNLVDRDHPHRAVSFTRRHIDERAREIGEAAHEGVAEYIQIIRPAVMQDVPDDLDTGIACGLEHGQDTRKIVDARRGLDEMPA